MLKHAVIAGLLSTGCEVHDLGILPTPTCGYAIRRLKAAGGIQITASHNPAPWNGLKLFGRDGAVLPAAEGEKAKALYDTGPLRRAAWDGQGSARTDAGILDRHRDLALALADAGRVRARRYDVLLDGNGGSGGPLGRRLLEALGCVVEPLACEPDGQFRHEPEPTPAHLRDVAAEVSRRGCAAGFCLDPDADR